MQHIMIIELENKGNLPCKLTGPCFQKPERRRIGIATGINGELKVIVRVVPGRIRCKTSSRTMLKPLIDRENDQLPGPRQFTGTQHTGDIRLRPGIVTTVPTENFLNPISHNSLQTTLTCQNDGCLCSPLNRRLSLLDIETTPDNQRYTLV